MGGTKGRRWKEMRVLAMVLGPVGSRTTDGERSQRVFAVRSANFRCLVGLPGTVQ